LINGNMLPFLIKLCNHSGPSRHRKVDKHNHFSFLEKQKKVILKRKEKGNKRKKNIPS
jgi:hypothetical protein